MVVDKIVLGSTFVVVYSVLVVSGSVVVLIISRDSIGSRHRLVGVPVVTVGSVDETKV